MAFLLIINPVMVSSLAFEYSMDSTTWVQFLFYVTTDINECANSNPCEQNCINTDGGYNCSCKNGYTLNEDGYSCNGIFP